MKKEIKNFSSFLYRFFKKIFVERDFKKFFTTEDEYYKRISICNSCGFLKRNFFNKKRCGVCGCFINTKALFEFEKCPIEKW